MTNVKPQTIKRPPTPDPKDVICPHQHFKYDIIDRDILSRKQHLNLLCTPKGYRWVVVKNDPLDMTPDEVSAHPCRVVKKKPGKTYVHNILAELWDLLTPEMVTRLKEMLMVEFGLSEEAAVEFICHSRYDTLRTAHRTKQKKLYEEDEDVKPVEDPTLPRLIVEPKMCDKSQFAVGIDPCHIREFSRIVSTKFSEYVVAMMCARRNNRHRRMAEVVLNGLCELTGENTSLDNPKNRLHKILALTSDRVALWLAQNMDEEDIKRDRRRKREDEILRRKRKEKQKEQERRRKEKERMNKEIERNRRRREKEEEDEEKRKNEEQEKKNAEKEKRRQEIEKFREQDKKKKQEDKKKAKEDGDKKEAGQKKKREGKDGKQKAKPKSAQAGGDRGGGRTDKSSTGKDQKSSKGQSQQKTATERPSSNKSRAGTAATQSSKSSTSKADKAAPAKRSQSGDANKQRASGEERAQGGTSPNKTGQPAEQSLADGEPEAPNDGTPAAPNDGTPAAPSDGTPVALGDGTDEDQKVADGRPSKPVPAEGGGGLDVDGPQPIAENGGPPGEGKQSQGRAEPEPVPSAASGKGAESGEPAGSETVPSAATGEGTETEGLKAGDKTDPTVERSVPPSAQAVDGDPKSQHAETPEKTVEERIIAATTSQIGSTKTESSPRQETLQDILSKELEKRIQPKDQSTVDVIREVASKTATWIDQNVKDAETEYGSRDKLARVSPVSQKPKGPIFVLRKIDPTEKIYDVRTSTHTEAGKKIRTLRRRASGRYVTSAPTDPSDPKIWAKWAKDASEMADDWGRWIDKTIQDAEDKAVQYQAKAKDGITQPEDNEDWNRFVENTNEDALTWRRMKRSFDEAAKTWKLHAQ